MVDQALCHSALTACFPHPPHLQVYHSSPLKPLLVTDKSSMRETTLGDILNMSEDSGRVTKTWQRKEIMSDSGMALGSLSDMALLAWIACGLSNVVQLLELLAAWMNNC